MHFKSWNLFYDDTNKLYNKILCETAHIKNDELVNQLFVSHYDKKIGGFYRTNRSGFMLYILKARLKIYNAIFNHYYLTDDVNKFLDDILHEDFFDYEISILFEDILMIKNIDEDVISCIKNEIEFYELLIDNFSKSVGD